jgi:hypothetical protein
VVCVCMGRGGITNRIKGGFSTGIKQEGIRSRTYIFRVWGKEESKGVKRGCGLEGVRTYNFLLNRFLKGCS